MEQITINNPRHFISEIIKVTIPKRTVRHIIKHAGYYEIKDDILLNANNLSHNPGSRYMAVWNDPRISDPIKEILSMTVELDGKKLKGRPATIEELACYEEFVTDHYGVIKALGEEMKDKDGRMRNTCRRRCNSPGVVLDFDWVIGDTYLVVFE